MITGRQVDPLEDRVDALDGLPGVVNLRLPTRIPGITDDEETGPRGHYPEHRRVWPGEFDRHRPSDTLTAGRRGRSPVRGRGRRYRCLAAGVEAAVVHPLIEGVVTH